jgi:hypothetical protein
MLRKGLWLGAVLVVLAGLVGCSSSSDGGTANDPVSLPPADPSNTNPADCPFSGGTTPTNGGTASAPATVSQIQPSGDGCIDNVDLTFATDVPQWSAAYTTGPVNDAAGTPVSLPSGVSLVVTLANTTYGPGGPTGQPATVASNGLDYVNQITVVPGSGGSLQIVMSLDQQLDYLVSTSAVPASLTIAFG